MTFLLYILLSFVESTAIFMLALQTYRFHASEYRWQLIFSALLVSFLSYLNRMELGLESFDVVIQLVAYILLFTFLFRVNILSSGLMALTGYAGNVIMQFIVYGALTITGVVNPENIKTETDSGTILIQASSIVLTFLVAGLLYKTDVGFSFVPHGRRFKLNSENKLLMLLIALCTLFIGICFFFYQKNHSQAVAISAAVLFLVLSSLIFFSFQKETRR